MKTQQPWHFMTEQDHRLDGRGGGILPPLFKITMEGDWHMGEYTKVSVYNWTEKRMGRAGFAFVPKETREVYVTKAGLQEIQACEGLQVTLHEEDEQPEERANEGPVKSKKSTK